MGDIDTIEMPITAGETYTLIGVVRMLVIGLSGEIENGSTAVCKHFDGCFFCAIPIVDIDALIINVGSCFHPNAVAWLGNVDGSLKIEKWMLGRTVCCGVVGIGSTPDGIANDVGIPATFFISSLFQCGERLCITVSISC